MIGDALDDIPEDTPEKTARLTAMVDAEAGGTFPAEFEAQSRWIGNPVYRDGK